MFTTPSAKMGMSSTRKVETLKELYEEFEKATSRMEENDVDEDEMKSLVKTISYLGKRIKDVAKKNESKATNPASPIFDPNAIVAMNNVASGVQGQQANVTNAQMSTAAPTQSTNVAIAPTSNTQTGPVPLVPPAPQTQSNLTISAAAPVYQTMTLITTPTNRPQATAPYATPSRSILKPKYAFDASVYRAGAVENRRGSVITSRKDHENHDDKNRRKFYLEFITGLPKDEGFKNIHVEDLLVVKESENAIFAAVDVISINDRLENKFRQTDSEDMFCIRIFGTSGDPRDIVDHRSVFHEWMMLTPEQIIKSCDCFTAYMNDDSWNDDLMWSTHTILNSIEDPNLKVKVVAKLSAYFENQRVGPLALYFTLTEIAYCDTTTLNNLINGLAKIRLDMFPNEDTHKHAHVWQRMLLFLGNFNKVPTHAVTMLLDQYRECSVPEFRMHFNMLASFDDPRLEAVETIFLEGFKVQRRLQTQKAWHPTTKAGSVFMGAVTPAPAEGPKKGPKQIPQKPGNEVTKKERSTHDRLGNPIDRHPPKKGEPHERENALTKKKESWCGNPKCQRWGNHVSSGHDEWYKKMCESRKKFKAKKGEEKKPEGVKPPAGGALTIPRANYASTIGEGFHGQYPF